MAIYDWHEAPHPTRRQGSMLHSAYPGAVRRISQPHADMGLALKHHLVQRDGPGG